MFVRSGTTVVFKTGAQPQRGTPRSILGVPNYQKGGKISCTGYVELVYAGTESYWKNKQRELETSVASTKANSADRLLSGRSFQKGDKLVSSNGIYTLVFQTNGKICLYRSSVQKGNDVGFVGPSVESGAVKALMAPNGNFCISNGSKNIWW